MQLKNLHIESYRHLENISFDFTYPEGHEKAGKPLEKICIIGQSATGKTNILELIKNSLLKLDSLEVINGNYLINRHENHFTFNLKGSLEYLYKDDILIISEEKIIKNKRELIYSETGGTLEKLINDGLKLLYISSEIISKETINIFNQNPLNIKTEVTDMNQLIFLRDYTTNYVYEFLQKIDEKIWFSLLSRILEYRKKFNQMASELLNKGVIGDANKLHKEYAKWSSINENPLQLFANYFNPILQKLNLEIDLINTEYFIPVKSKINDEVIPISSLSTGTKGLLLSMFPLFELDTNDSIVLLDEPERSLFPDMQIDLIPHYQRLAPNAQIIVATHSPFIAAAFEPEERFILYFDEKGKVAVRRGESPIGDDPNDILRNDFKVDYYNDFGKKAYKEYLDLKRKAAQETQPEEKNRLIVELAELGDKYNF